MAATSTTLELMTPRSAFGPLLAEIRKRHGLTQRALAEAVGKHENYVQMLETGRRGERINYRLVVELAQAIDASLAEYSELMDAAGFYVADLEDVEGFIKNNPALDEPTRRAMLSVYRALHDSDGTG